MTPVLSTVLPNSHCCCPMPLPLRGSKLMKGGLSSGDPKSMLNADLSGPLASGSRMEEANRMILEGFFTSDKRVAASTSSGSVGDQGLRLVMSLPPWNESPPMKTEFMPNEGISLMPKSPGPTVPGP